jgi:tetratricopeptide (TPR) repeat protein
MKPDAASIRTGLIPGQALCLLLACCGAGCQFMGQREAVPKQVATCRQLYQRGLTAMERGQWEQAEALLAQSVATCPVDPEARRHYAEALWRRGAAEKAVEQLREALRLSADDPAIAARLGQMYLDKGQIDQARQLAHQAIDQNPQLAAGWALRARVERASGQLDRALADYCRTLEFQRNDRELLLETAELYRQLGRPQRALSTLEALRESYRLGEEPPQILYLQGLAYTALARYDDAIDVYHAALGRTGAEPSAELYYRLAEAQWLAGRAGEAYRAIDHALRLAPGHPPSLALRGRIELAQGSPPTVRQ